MSKGKKKSQAAGQKTQQGTIAAMKEEIARGGPAHSSKGGVKSFAYSGKESARRYGVRTPLQSRAKEGRPWVLG